MAGTLPADSAYAVDLGYGINLGAGATDNVRRSPTDEQSESIGTAGANFSLFEKSRRLNADLAGDFTYLKYFDDTFDDEVLGNFGGNVRLGIVPERFEWLFADTFGQATQRSFEVVTPENRQNVNYFTTGPSFTIRLGSAIRAQLNGRYSSVTYEETPLDSERYGGNLALLHDLSSSSSVSINLSVQQVDYDDDSINTDFDYREGFLRYDVSGSRTRIGFDIGYTEVERLQQKASGLLTRLDLSRQVSPSSTLNVQLGREYSDAGNIFSQLESLGGVTSGTQSVQQTSEPFTNEFVTLGWDFSRNRTGFGVSLSGFKEAYEQPTSLDRTRLVAGLYGHRDLTPALQLRGLVQQIREEYDSISTQDFDELYATAVLSWKLGRRLLLQVQYERSDRDGHAMAGDYAENRGWIRLAYAVSSERERAPRIPIATGAFR